jgi:hypothetical protein
MGLSILDQYAGGRRLELGGEVEVEAIYVGGLRALYRAAQGFNPSLHRQCPGLQGFGSRMDDEAVSFSQS